jgi:hypothetical protein
MTSRRSSGPIRTWIGGACLASALAWSTPARADDAPLGVAGAFAFIGAVAAAATPYLVFSNWKDPGFATLGIGLGAGRHLDAFGLAGDFGGYMRKRGFFGWMGRARFDIAGKELSKNGYIALRIDSVALFLLAGDPSGPLSIEGLAGLTAWPRLETTATGDVHAFVGVGPSLGLRMRTTVKRPRIYGEVEAGYAPLFGRPPTGKLHHLELGPAIGFTPWRNASGVFSFEMRSRFEVGLGGADVGRTAGVVLLGGVRLRVEQNKQRDVRPAQPTPRAVGN